MWVVGSAYYSVHGNAGVRSASCGLLVRRMIIKTTRAVLQTCEEALFNLFIAAGVFFEEQTTAHAVILSLVLSIRDIADVGEREAEIRSVLGSGGRPSKKNKRYTEGALAAEFRAQVDAWVDAQDDDDAEYVEKRAADASNSVSNMMSMARRVARHTGKLPEGDSLAAVYRAIIAMDKKPPADKPADKPDKPAALPPVAELKALIIRACRNDEAHAIACFDALAEAMDIMARAPIGSAIRRAGKTAFAD